MDLYLPRGLLQTCCMLLQVKTIIERLLEVLNTPSASVQSSVSSCMPSLLPKVKGDQQYVKDLIQRLLDRCLKGEKYAHR